MGQHPNGKGLVAFFHPDVKSPDAIHVMTMGLYIPNIIHPVIHVDVTTQCSNWLEQNNQRHYGTFCCHVVLKKSLTSFYSCHRLSFFFMATKATNALVRTYANASNDCI